MRSVEFLLFSSFLFEINSIFLNGFMEKFSITFRLNWMNNEYWTYWMNGETASEMVIFIYGSWAASWQFLHSKSVDCAGVLLLEPHAEKWWLNGKTSTNRMSTAWLMWKMWNSTFCSNQLPGKAKPNILISYIQENDIFSAQLKNQEGKSGKKSGRMNDKVKSQANRQEYNDTYGRSRYQ